MTFSWKLFDSVGCENGEILACEVKGVEVVGGGRLGLPLVDKGPRIGAGAR